MTSDFSRIPEADHAHPAWQYFTELMNRYGYGPSETFAAWAFYRPGFEVGRIYGQGDTVAL